MQTAPSELSILNQKIFYPVPTLHVQHNAVGLISALESSQKKHNC